MPKRQNKIAVITGATSGVGLEISLILIYEGYKVYLIGQTFDKLKKVLLKSKHKKDIYFLKADLSIKEEIDSIINNIKSSNIDLLIHCAGIISYNSFELSTIDNFDLQYNINVRAPYLITKKLFQKVKKSMGQILFINSTAGLEYFKNLSQYCASKHALKALSKSLRLELLKDNIKVTNLFLGATDTPMQEKIQKIKENKYIKEKFIDTVELARIVLFIINLPKNINISDLTLLPINTKIK